MRIDALNHVSKVYQSNNNIKTQSVNKKSSSDKFELSGVGKDIQVVTQALKNILDTRGDKVTQIKAGIENGTYNVSDNTLADKLIENFENNKL